MDYRESLDYLYGLQHFGIKLGLENIRSLLERLGRPHRNLRFLHIGGSNGKGSVAACLSEILTRAGYRTGLYTSPHLHSFTERIRIDGLAIAESQVAALAIEIRCACTDIPATFFEFTTALALLHFQRQQVDFVVLEVGLGGRLDATNVVDPLVSVITPICRDHVEHLGADLPAIAREKGGIIKAGVPLVVGRQPPEVLQLLGALARESRAPMFACGDHFASLAETGGFSYRGPEMNLAHLHPGLPGRHQHDNLALALTVAALLRRQGIAVPTAALRAGVEHVFWPGRMEWWCGGRDILLDGAHNEGGARVLAQYLDSLRLGKKVRWVVGVKGDKRAPDILEPILPHCGSLYCTTPPLVDAVPAAELARAAQEKGWPACVFSDPAAALEAALRDRQSGELVLVAGSLFLVASAREYLLLRAQIPA
ncbi:MAG: folylpolyglutamate synthase/dihydrofolate synthase family protein [Desulfuromonadales bacterium]